VTNNTIILPTARLVPVELQAEFGSLPSCMLPLGGHPLLRHVHRYHIAESSDFRVGVGQQANVIRDYIERNKLAPLTLVDASDSLNLAQTIFRCLSIAPINGGVIVHFADTWLEEPLPEGDVAFVAGVEDSFRWTTVTTDNDGRIDRILDKGSLVTTGDVPLAFVGVFRFENGILLADCLDTAIRKSNVEEPFWTALIAYSRAREGIGSGLRLRRTERWFDLGHLDTFFRASRELHLGVRSFNEVTIDVSRGVITKASTRHAAKLIAETAWYQRLPNDLSWAIPRIFGHKLSQEHAWVQMEYYGYPVLSDAYLSANWDLGAWGQAFRAIGNLLDEFGRYRMTPPLGGFELDLHEMYVSKTLERLESLRDHSIFRRLSKTVICNELPLPSLIEVFEVIEALVKDSNTRAHQEFCIIHGDLCLSNIVFDRRNQIVRVLDPRGAFGRWDLYGDPDYDLAKLSHSLHGDYDFLVRGLFSINWVATDRVSFKVPVEPRHAAIKWLFEDWLLKRLDGDVRRVRLLEALLFLSMAPLHGDRPMSQEAFLLRGLQLFKGAMT
jgi:hypothetical protein